MNSNPQYAPLAALGSFVEQQDFCAPLREYVQLDCKTVIHTPHEKLLDVVVSMLADCASLKQINTRLRPDTARAAAWGRERFADQSTLTRVLDAFTPLAVAQLRTAVEQIYRREGQALHHPFAHDLLFLDIDLTGLPAGRRAEANTKGYFSGEKTAVGANSPGSAPHSTMKVWCRWSIPAISPVRPVCTPRSPRHYYRRTQTAVLKWKTEQGKYGHSLLTTSLREYSLRELAERYDDRAAIEAEFKAEKGGLQLHRRRKQRLAAQEALVLLTDLAHNLLAWTRGWLFGNSPFVDAGIYRIVKELFPIPGKGLVQEGQIVK